MFIDFFYHLRAHEIPVSIGEYLSLLEALRQPVMPPTLDSFYVLARTILVKDESLFDKYDVAFGKFYREHLKTVASDKEIPLDWLISDFKRHLSAEDQAAIKKLGWEALIALFKQRLEEQESRHAGGSKWIGTGGTSPFGNSGFNPQGLRLGEQSAENRSAVKVWEQREFKDYDDQQELGPRNFKIALRRLRRFAREGVAEELDLPGTIRSTASNAGMLDIKMTAERKNNIKVLMLLDVGGSMDDHIRLVEDLFSAARSEFKHLEVYYFHNCPYETVWTHNDRRHHERTPTWDLIHRYNSDWRLILVGDATMSPYEIMTVNGSVEHNNSETGAVWLQRLLTQWPKAIWLNPQPKRVWQYPQTIAMVQHIMQDRMYDISLSGLEAGMRYLSK